MSQSVPALGLVLAIVFGARSMSVSAADTSFDLTPPAEGTRVLLVTGNDYPGHLWRQTAPALRDLLAQDTRLQVRIVEDPNALASPKLRQWDMVVLHFMNWQCPSPGTEVRENLRRFVESGKGLMLIHFACGAWQDWPEFKHLVGRVYDPKLPPHDPHGVFQVMIADPNHPVTKGMKDFETNDELYTCLTGDASIHVVANARSKVDDKVYPMAFVLDYGKGRVFHTVLGHDVRALTNSAVPELLRRGCAWAAGLPTQTKPAGTGK
jgi:type 1 glutamine amidotransferase